MLTVYNTGNINPINEIGQKNIGLIYGDKYEDISNNKLIELNRYNIFSINDNWFIYFLLALKRVDFSTELRLS